MTQLSTQTLQPRESCPLAVPAWVPRLFGEQVNSADVGNTFIQSPDGRWTLARASIAGADAMDDDTLERQTQIAYCTLLEQVRDSSAPYPVRGWNAIPAITRSQRQGLDRYMAFNAGRHAAYQAFFDDKPSLQRIIPTASAIGHGMDTLAISLLAHHQPGQAIENPRQVPALRYSNRYGPTPPAFARATVLPGENESGTLLVAGTASVVGEDSRHANDIEQQLQETYRNLASVLRAADQQEHAHRTLTSEQRAQALAQYRSARVYIRRRADVERVCVSVQASLTGLEELEVVHADICRPELLVEIEGVASMNNPGQAT